MVDLTGYRCLISVNYLSDIPKNLEITVGDYSLLVLIQLERWGRRDVVNLGNPPNELTDLMTLCREILRFIAAQPDQRRKVLSSDPSLRQKSSPIPADSIRQGEEETIRKGPAIVETRGATVWNSKFPDADVTLNEIPDVDGGCSIIAADGFYSETKGKDFVQAPRGPILISFAGAPLHLGPPATWGPFRSIRSSPLLGPTGTPTFPGLTVGRVGQEPDSKVVAACLGSAFWDCAPGPISTHNSASFEPQSPAADMIPGSNVGGGLQEVRHVGRQFAAWASSWG
uniref:Uncharacterized protein n=1 Tax=Ananas comosus var. bracteatus TaxID=296719 RepID=A0A6V7NVU1_ANACO|nr:unnamed protein product [Ananas comosus var. bracteatus]